MLIAQSPVAQGSMQACTPFKVLDACHQQTLNHLSELQSLCDQVARHGLDNAARQRARSAHLYFTTTVLNHHLDEERHVFPALLRSGDDALRRTVERLQQEHVRLEASWLALAPQLDALARGYGEQGFPGLKHRIDLFARHASEHIALEESVVYPQSRIHLEPNELSSMSREMTWRRHPQQDALDPDGGAYDAGED